ncbi:cobyrinate a,c-diamide synthase [Methylomonas sp. HYX-M1]|uniref:cobyrinate a,c-diamide synthase n=1 Tax=Methylomonas sp. HYX-M1 TaxID=3139307 RepID=UPI00345BC523
MTDRVACPALLVCAPASGQGKTSVAAALARLHSRNGLRVRCFKTGPDFIDPTILAKASGRPVCNLDTWIMGVEHCRGLLYQAAGSADLLIVEGVMGLFDGEPSSADLAEAFGLPIAPVIDASAMAQTFAAVLHGLATFRPSLRLAGAVANRVGSAYHGELLRAAVPKNLALACLPRLAEAVLPGRHLGLQLAEEIADIDRHLDVWADSLAGSWLAELPPPVYFSKPAAQPAPAELLAGKTIAVARDRAFCFLYPQNLDCLERLGAHLTFFSPLADRHLAAADAVYLPGGYPELYGAQLAANLSLKADLQRHAGQGKPVLAECGGMLYALESLIDCDGRTWPMLGLLPGTARMGARVAAIGSQAALCQGVEIRGHSFHYSTAEVGIKPWTIALTPDGRAGEAVYRHGALTASYLHFYFPSAPEWLAACFLLT